MMSNWFGSVWWLDRRDARLSSETGRCSWLASGIDRNVVPPQGVKFAVVLGISSWVGKAVSGCARYLVCCAKQAEQTCCDDGQCQHSVWDAVL